MTNSKSTERLTATSTHSTTDSVIHSPRISTSISTSLDSTLGFTRLFATGLTFLGLAASGSAFAASGGGTIITTTNVPRPSIDRSIYAIDTSAYDAECDGKTPQTYTGNLVLSTPVQIEDYRCIRTVYGDLTIDTANSVRGFTLPWLSHVTGDLELEGNSQLPYARLPRLTSVGDKIVVDAFYGDGTRWEARSLEKHAGTFAVEAGTSTDLRGFDDLEDIGILDLWLAPVNAPINPQTPTFRGLSGVTSVGRLEVDTSFREAHQTPDFLESLVEVRGKAHVETRYELIATDAIEFVGGNLDIVVEDNYGSSSADGLESLREVGGNFTWSATDLYDISALSHLETVGGDLELPLDVTSLAGFASLESVGGDFSLVGDVDVPDLSALASLNAVHGRFTIESSGIGSLNGLQGLTYLGSLRIHDNTSLSNVAALGNASLAGFSSAQITNNSPLTNCQANTLLNSMTIPTTTTKTVSGNVSPCIGYSQAISSSVLKAVLPSGRSR